MNGEAALEDFLAVAAGPDPRRLAERFGSACVLCAEFMPERDWAEPARVALGRVLPSFGEGAFYGMLLESADGLAPPPPFVVTAADAADPAKLAAEPGPPDLERLYFSAGLHWAVRVGSEVFSAVTAAGPAPFVLAFAAAARAAYPEEFDSVEFLK